MRLERPSFPIPGHAFTGEQFNFSVKLHYRSNKASYTIIHQSGVFVFQPYLKVKIEETHQKGRLVKSPYKPTSTVPSSFQFLSLRLLSKGPTLCSFHIGICWLVFSKKWDKNTLRWYDFEITGNQNPDKTRWRLSETSDSRIPVSTGCFWLRNWLPANREICFHEFLQLPRSY